MSLFPRLISASASPTQIQFYKNSPFFPLKIMRAVLPSAARPSLATSSQSLCLEELLKPRNYRCALVTPRSLARPWWHRAPFFFTFGFPFSVVFFVVFFGYPFSVRLCLSPILLAVHTLHLSFLLFEPVSPSLRFLFLPPFILWLTPHLVTTLLLLLTLITPSLTPTIINPQVGTEVGSGATMLGKGSVTWRARIGLLGP